MWLEQLDKANGNTSTLAEIDTDPRMLAQYMASDGMTAQVETNTKRILVVDDELDLVVMIAKSLRYKGYDVIIAKDGQEGLEKAKTQKPDLIILDLMLPRIDGYKVCELLKKDTLYATIPVILLTAKANAEDIDRGKKVGADAYITKPYERDILFSKIKELLEK
jgi:DNA-binding response OmpR family regulator